MRIRYSGSHGLRCENGMVWHVMLCHAVVVLYRTVRYFDTSAMQEGEVNWLID